MGFRKSWRMGWVTLTGATISVASLFVDSIDPDVLSGLDGKTVGSYLWKVGIGVAIVGLRRALSKKSDPEEE